ncbi:MULTISPECIES: hypothetical protein, partial [unclassified Polaromonas]|uniref:hypothetical protein n=1 Tax=unclassified Polaromonas TaxID=2638319 RepID=UPI001E2B9845
LLDSFAVLLCTVSCNQLSLKLYTAFLAVVKFCLTFFQLPNSAAIFKESRFVISRAANHSTLTHAMRALFMNYSKKL